MGVPSKVEHTQDFGPPQWKGVGNKETSTGEKSQLVKCLPCKHEDLSIKLAWLPVLVVIALG